MPAKKPSAVTFVSANKSLRAIRKCAEQTLRPDGGVAVTSPEKVYEFHHGRLVLTPGQDVMTDYLPSGETVEQDAVAWLRNEIANRSEIGGRVVEAVAPAPDPTDELREITRLASRGDIDALVAMGDQEAQEWARDQVLDAINDALDGIKEAAAEKEPAKK